MDVMPVFVCCHTNGWTQQMVNGFTKHFPDMKMLAIDNNPYVYQKIEFDRHGYHTDPSWNISCEIERKFINQHPNIIVVKSFNYSPLVKMAISHGQALDIAVMWCKKNNINIMLCIEPDSLIQGTKWFYDLLKPIEQEGYWHSHYGLHGGYLCGHNNAFPRPHMNPTMWSTRNINLSFDAEWKGKELFVYDERDDLIKYWENKRKRKRKLLNLDFGGWDTGQKLWFNNVIKYKSKELNYDQCRDFIHLWSKSQQSNWDLNYKKEPLLLGEWKYI